MTFKAKYDLKNKLQFALLAVGASVTFGAFIIDDNIMALLFSLPLILGAVVCGMQLYRTEYTLGSDLLTARSGFSRVSVGYRDIALVSDLKDTPVYGYVPLATAANKLYIVYYQDGKAYRLEISPRDREDFIKALEEKL